jgi:hypothetical protein
METKVAELAKYYRKITEMTVSNGLYKEETGPNAKFIPSEFMDLYFAFEEIIKKGLIDTNGWLADAGAGDGRVISLAATLYQIPSIGIEFSQELVNIAKEGFCHLKQKSIIDNTPTIIVSGDFTDDDTYAKAGLKFEQITTHFNYHQNEDKIAKKIYNQSKKDTVFLLRGYPFRNKIFCGLTLETTIDKYHVGDLKHPKNLLPVHVYKLI